MKKQIKKRLAYLCRTEFPSKFASSVQIIKSCQAFSDNDLDVTLYCYGNKEGLNNSDIAKYYGINANFSIEFIEKSNSLIAPFTYQKNLRKKLKHQNFNYVYSRTLFPLMFLSKKKTTFLFEAHSSFNRKAQRYLFLFLIKLKKIDYVVSITKSLKDNIIHTFKLDKNKIIIASDAAVEKPLDEKINLNGNNKGLNVGYVGSFYSGKGIDIILEVAKIMLECNFHLVGGTDDMISLYRKKYELDNVFYYGHVNHKMVYKYINSFDICMLPNQNIVNILNNKNSDIGKFTSPLKLFEYMAQKKPIIASNLPVLKEILNQKNSLLVDPTAPLEWKKAINSLKAKSKRLELGENAYKDYLKNYTWKKRNSQIIKQLY